MNIGALIVLFKLLQDSGVVSPGKPLFFGKPPRPPTTPPSGEQGLRPDCGIGQKAKLENGQWTCVPLFN